MLAESHSLVRTKLADALAENIPGYNSSAIYLLQTIYRCRVRDLTAHIGYPRHLAGATRRMHWQPITATFLSGPVFDAADRPRLLPTSGEHSNVSACRERCISDGASMKAFWQQSILKDAVIERLYQMYNSSASLTSSAGRI